MLAGTIGEMLDDGELWRHLQATVGRMFRGFAIGSLAGLSCGLLMGAVAFIRRSLDPLISALWASPKLTLLPMLMIIFGVEDAPRIILIAAGCFIVVALHTLDAVRMVDPSYVELAANYGAGRAAILRRVYLPAVMPAVFTANRLALGRALTLTVSVELVSSPEGLGSMIFLAWQSFMTDRLYIGIMVTAGMGMLFHTSLRLVEGRLITWRGDAQKA
jgi:ABC-type nitrate/sulfonate/bicarbonate transport system permease component